MTHGADPPSSPRGPYGRLFGFLAPCALSRDEVARLCAHVDTGAVGLNPLIPAGYTYLAQFVDHDLTFDPASLGQRLDGARARTSFRTPRLDLDSLYGSGPDDQPYLYDGAKLLLGGTGDLPDLPRNVHERAIIGDPRNDEHLLIAQLHLLFMRFHNAVVERVARRFEEAQRIVRWHYQWIVLHDFLDRVLGRPLAADVRAQRRFFHWTDEPFIPLEFSGAAFRFAHSMVRGDYELNAAAVKAQAGIRILPASPDADPLEHLGGHRALPEQLKIHWPFFFGSGDGVIPSHRIGPALANPLKRLPADLDRDRRGLERLDVLRGLSLALPCGRDVARAMSEPELTPAELGEGLPDALPLWYYVLAEAFARGGAGSGLGPVGGRIVGEVLVGLVEGDPNSYLRQFPRWRPTLPGRLNEDHELDFTMEDLVAFTG